MNKEKKKAYNKKYMKEYNSRPEVKAKMKEYYKKEKEKLNKRSREWLLKNKNNPKYINGRKKYRKKKKEHIAKQVRTWKDSPEGKAKIKASDKEYYQKHKKKIAKRTREYNQRFEVKERVAKRKRERIKKDSAFHLIQKLRRRFSHALKSYSTNGKQYSSKKYGISFTLIIEELMPVPKDIKDPQMDHIIPASWFDHDNPQEVKWCWSPENFQWLSKEENIRKGNRYIYIK